MCLNYCNAPIFKNLTSLQLQGNRLRSLNDVYPLLFFTNLFNLDISNNHLFQSNNDKDTTNDYLLRRS